jgi:hypothetical protein
MSQTKTIYPELEPRLIKKGDQKRGSWSAATAPRSEGDVCVMANKETESGESWHGRIRIRRVIMNQSPGLKGKSPSGSSFGNKPSDHIFGHPTTITYLPNEFEAEAQALQCIY